MSLDHSNSRTNNQVQENNLTNLNLQFESIECNSAVLDDIICDRNLTRTEQQVYQIINSYSPESGMFCLSDAQIAKKYGISSRHFRKICQSLEAKKYIYRVNHPLWRKGSRREIISKLYFKLYIQRCKEQRKFKWAAKVASFFLTNVSVDFAYEALKNDQFPQINWMKRPKILRSVSSNAPPQFHSC